MTQLTSGGYNADSLHSHDVYAQDITTHTSATSAHGTTSAIVGINDTQTLTSKTLTSPKINENVAVSATATEINLIADGITTSASEVNQAVDGIGGSVTATTLTQLTSGGYNASNLHNHESVSGSLSVGGSLTITGDLTVNGDTVTVNTSTLTVEDKNISVNKGGLGGTGNGSGLDILENDAVIASIEYNSALASKFKVGPEGAEKEIVTVSDTQTLTGKTLTLPKINSTTSVTASGEELNYVAGVTSSIQTQINSKSATGHTHILTSGATDVTATYVEINQVVDGIGASVTASTLTDLTSGGFDASSYHYHATDRARANHTGTQNQSTISPQGSGSGLDSDKLRGKAWVLTASGSGTITSDSSGSFTLETAGQHNQYIFSVYATSGTVDQTGASNDATADTFVPGVYAFIRRPSVGTDSLIINNHTASSEDVNYEVYAWKSV